MIATDPIIIKDKEQLIPFVNMINEICKVIDDEFVTDWITTHHNFLGKTPLEEFNVNGMPKVFDLLTLIEIDEADVID
tara:strand:+ start:220 stop:453 length:234 start_codon:yes stop_codon:yes gene_type:complete